MKLRGKNDLIENSILVKFLCSVFFLNAFNNTRDINYGTADLCSEKGHEVGYYEKSFTIKS